MARINKKGYFSGAVGNVVFVQNGDLQYIRSKPGKVKQSADTKKAASVFGWVSTRDKEFRKVLIPKFSLITDNRYAARHRARMAKILVSTNPDPVSVGPPSFGNPDALVGFDFNATLPWEKTTRFYPKFSADESGNVQVEIPALHWGKQIKPAKKTHSAVLKLEAFACDPNSQNLEITPLSTLDLPITSTQNQEATTWNFSSNLANHWILILGILTFESGQANLSALERTSTCYLWAKN